MVSSHGEQARNWRSLEINGNAYMIRSTTENESWKILLTNLTEIWVETLTDETMLRKCQTLNPLLTLQAFDWRELVVDMLNDVPKHTRTYVAEASACRIELQKEKDFIKLKFALDLVKGTAQHFWENVTMPVCLSLMELIRRHEILLDLVKQKDEEIAEYKAEGAELIRKHIATKPFSEELFHADAAAPGADFAKAFQSAFHFYNTMNLSSLRVKTELKVSSNCASSNDASEVGGSILPESPKSESAQTSRENNSGKHEQVYPKVEECEDEAVPSTSKAPILKLSNTSHKIQKSLKKNKKTLNDFIL
ncbi:hypothetical protein DMN91_006071 [Ooceraea biroi]|uniref:Non-homologous end-joining factor 1 n=1 Tax=Ooceraea biroi TaxID=2015173 RepID=A0A3L8DMM2_OOCBI|nr:hypothetical protein DMN91_006071 [Ooceraea biroi]